MAVDARITHLAGLARTGGGIGSRFDHTVGNDVTALIETWALDQSMTSAVIAGMLVRYSQIPEVNVILAADNPAAMRFTVPAPTEGDRDATANRTIAEIRDTPGTPLINYYKDIIDAYDRSGGWIIDLVAAYQIRPLNERNVSSYFKSKGGMIINGMRILPILKVMADNLPKLTGQAGINIENSAWTRYHTSYSSSPQLVMRALGIVGAAFPTMFSGASVAAVNAAILAPWDSALVDRIPKSALAATHAILFAFSMLPDRWMQGEKAVAEGSPVTYAAILAGCKRMKDLMANTSAIGSATNMTALSAAMPASCFNQ